MSLDDFDVDDLWVGMTGQNRADVEVVASCLRTLAPSLKRMFDQDGHPGYYELLDLLTRIQQECEQALVDGTPLYAGETGAGNE